MAPAARTMPLIPNCPETPVFGGMILASFVGIFAERCGARGALVLMGLVAVVAMIATPLAPSLFTGTALFAALVFLQVLLGVSQAATFPVSATTESGGNQHDREHAARLMH